MGYFYSFCRRGQTRSACRRRLRHAIQWADPFAPTLTIIFFLCSAAMDIAEVRLNLMSATCYPLVSCASHLGIGYKNELAAALMAGHGLAAVPCRLATTWSKITLAEQRMLPTVK
jgi:hypothetical protein